MISKKTFDSNWHRFDRLVFFYKSHIVTKLKKDNKITLKYILNMCIIQCMFITKNDIEILIYNSNLNILWSSMKWFFIQIDGKNLKP